MHFTNTVVIVLFVMCKDEESTIPKTSTTLQIKDLRSSTHKAGTASITKHSPDQQISATQTIGKAELHIVRPAPG